MFDTSYFDYNHNSTPLLICFIQGLLFAGLLWKRGRKENRQSDKWLCALLLLCCCYILQYILGFGGWYNYTDETDRRPIFMFYFPFFLLVFVGPVLYFYFRSLTNHKFKIQAKDWWHFALGALVLSVYIIIFLKELVWENWILGQPLPLFKGRQGYWSKFRQIYLPFIELGTISLVIYALFTTRIYYQYRQYINNHFSETTFIQFNWLKWILYTIIGGVFFHLFILIGAYAFDLDYQGMWYSHFVLGIMIYFLSIQGYIAVYKTTTPLKFEPVVPITVPNQQEVEGLNSCQEKLEVLMEKERPFLSSNLTLSELANRLNTNTSILSKTINTNIGQNFNDYINQKRVHAVEERLKANAAQQFTLTSIAFECGFNSKATFNRAFKKFTGKSPREYVKELDL